VLRTGSGATAWPARPVATSAATRPPAVPRMRVRTIASARTFRSLKKGLTRATPVGRHQEQGQPSGPHTGLLHDQGQQNEQVQHQREARDRRGGPRRPASASSITASQPIITAAGGVPHRGATACCPGQVRSRHGGPATRAKRGINPAACLGSQRRGARRCASVRGRSRIRRARLTGGFSDLLPLARAG